MTRADVLALVQQHGPCTSVELRRHAPQIAPVTLRMHLQRLRAVGLLDCVAVKPHRGPRLYRYFVPGLHLESGPLEDDGWQPAPWVHPYAKRRGMKQATSTDRVAA